MRNSTGTQTIFLFDELRCMQELLSVITCRKQKTNQLIKFTIQPTRKPKQDGVYGPCIPNHTILQDILGRKQWNKNTLRRRGFAVVRIGSITYTLERNTKRGNKNKKNEVLLSLELAPSPPPWEEILRDHVPNHTILQDILRIRIS
jgi:hypothetical protein